MYKLYYLTSDLDDMLPRYIGYTSKTLKLRLKQHIEDWRYKKMNNHKTNWINNVINNNDKILIFLIEETQTLEDALEREKQLISLHCGKLVNSTTGGENSKVLNDSVKEKISKSLKEHFKTNKHPNSGRKYGKTSEETKQLLRNKISKYKQFSYEELYDLYVTQRLTIAEIVENEKHSRKSLEIQLKRYNLPEERKKLYGQKIFKKETRKNIDLSFNKEKIINSYLNDKLTIEKLSEIYGVIPQTIRKILEEANVKMRTSKEQSDLASKIKQINQFTKEGVFIQSFESYQKLADYLNKKEVRFIRGYVILKYNGDISGKL